MKLFDVYPRYNVNIVQGKAAYVYDENQTKYLDFYGGHAVVSIGHSHPHYIKRITDQLNDLGFYSNSIEMPIQDELADHLGRTSKLPDYQLFLVNSGAEANENALKLASFHNGRSKVIAFDKAFHGRTSAAVQCTDNQKIIAPINRGYEVVRLPLNDIEQLKAHLNDDVAAVIVEGIQGIGGIYEAESDFLLACQQLCEKNNSVLVLDEIQCGYGRSGDFFSFQKIKDFRPDIITVAKGMGNGFPVGGVLIHPKFQPSYGLLGTTFGGNHLACAASLAVLEVMDAENILDNVHQMGEILKQELSSISSINEIRGRGLMLAIDFDYPIAEIRKQLIFDQKVFTGSAKAPETMRLLPPLNIGEEEVALFISALKKTLK
ncbi:aspartate aminotransferase family protein [Membranihabitans marinus]|uniref:aspartate aminotransferase family protein n=1 Tax=Membranihabitans marinus TaxID=1227546 RepID=UPI001F0229F7|nr:aminotransferase class III-fold pyridoxal phosphate-dependent enzyme [Membranihabitans marinus]